MQRRRPFRDAALRLDMTPLIDVVFLLMIFFLLTFRIAGREGDFDIRRPLSGSGAKAMAAAPPPVIVQAIAADSGALVELSLNDRRFPDPEALQAHLVRLLEAFPADRPLEVQVRADRRLSYQYLVDVVGAVSRHRDASGAIGQLPTQVSLASEN